MADHDPAVPHGPDEPCTCPGCWACTGHVIGCTCDIDWDAVAERARSDMAAVKGQTLRNYMLGEIANLVSMIPALKSNTEHGAYGTVLAAMDDMMTQMRPVEDGPVLRITADQALYPQYNLEERLREWRRSPEVTRWLADQARAHLAEDRGTPNVRAHWRWLATFDPGA